MELTNRRKIVYSICIFGIILFPLVVNRILPYNNTETEAENYDENWTKTYGVGGQFYLKSTGTILGAYYITIWYYEINSTVNVIDFNSREINNSEYFSNDTYNENETIYQITNSTIVPLLTEKKYVSILVTKEAYDLANETAQIAFSKWKDENDNRKEKLTMFFFYENHTEIYFFEW